MRLATPPFVEIETLARCAAPDIVVPVAWLSELPFVQDVHWGVMTIGTGLGNAVFTNRRPRA